MIIAAPTIPGLPHFSAVLRGNFPVSYDRANKVFTKADSFGRVLARIPRSEISNFKTQTNADNRFLTYPGLEAYLGPIVENSSVKGLRFDATKRELIRTGNSPHQGLRDFHDIKVLGSLVLNHPLAKFISQEKPLFAEDFIAILKSGFVDLHILRKLKNSKVSSGVLEASQGPSHGDSVWTRDMAAVALGELDMNAPVFASRIAIKLYEAYASPSQRERINGLLKEPSLWHTPNAREHIPHTKFDVEEIKDQLGEIIDYKLVDLKSDWGMQQLDAYGYLLAALAKLAMRDDKYAIDLKAIDKRVQTEHPGAYNDHHNRESTLVALTRMLLKVEYWNQEEFGAWENQMHMRRASSIAACLNGLKFVREYCRGKGKDSLVFDNGHGNNYEAFMRELDTGIKQGEESLFSGENSRIKTDGRAHEIDPGSGHTGDKLSKQHKEREKDAALLFILVLSDPEMLGLSEEHKKSIIKTVEELMGDVGFKRFKTDEYMGQNWTFKDCKNKTTQYHEHADISDPNYEAAQWSFFDPYLANYYYKEFIKSEGSDLESYLKADRYARRALAQISKTNFSFPKTQYEWKDNDWKATGQTEIKVPAGEAMEHYWYATKDPKTGEPLKEGMWMAGENYRLNWTKIALQQMIYNGSHAGELFKKQYPNGWDEKKILGLNLSMLGKESHMNLPKKTKRVPAIASL